MRLLLKFRRYFYNLGGFSKILGISSGNLEDSSAATWLTRARHPRSQRHPQRFCRPQINTDCHRLRAKALNESPGNHRYRLTSVYQPERVNQGTCPCDPRYGITLLLIHCDSNHLEMIHWGHTGLTLEEHWTLIGGT